MDCRIGCGACCIAPSISSPLPRMPLGKAAGVRCLNLDAKNSCLVWGTPDYPKVCAEFRPHWDSCGTSAEQALGLLGEMERLTAPV